MAYEMNAEGINGVQQTTYLTFNSGAGPNWIVPPFPANASVMFFINAYPVLESVGGVQSLGVNASPGVVGQTLSIDAVVGPGVGVGGYNVQGFSKIDGSYSFNTSKNEMAGVYGECDGGPGVKGRGGNAVTDQKVLNWGPAVAAGVGVLGIGGASAPATTGPSSGEQVGAPKTIKLEAQPPGEGVIGLGGRAKAPIDTGGTGVVGIGAPAANSFDAARGAVFGAGGNCAQLQLIPVAPAGSALYPDLPLKGNLGDIWVGLLGKVNAAMYLCVFPHAFEGTKLIPAAWAPFTLGKAQPGGTPATYLAPGL